MLLLRTSQTKLFLSLSHLSFCLLVISLFLSNAQAQDPDAAPSDPTGPSRLEDPTNVEFAKKVPASLLQMAVSSGYYSSHAFVVDKKARSLSVWLQESGGFKQVAQFPADLGRQDGDKRASGDHRTPEGIYFLLNRLEGPSLDFGQYGQRAFTTDYPNFFDRLDGKTGNGIWLHAVPDKTPLTRGSRGCVVVRNNVIGSLTQYVRLQKTPILIEKEVDYVLVDDLRASAQQLNQTIETWRTAWEQKDINRYISFYGDDFKAMGMTRDQWKTYKQGLNDRYRQLGIKLSRPILLRYKDGIVARFLQNYTSDQHTDFGEKTLYMKKTSSGFRIVGEEWAGENSRLAHDELEASSLAAACAPGTQCSTTHAASAN